MRFLVKSEQELFNLLNSKIIPSGRISLDTETNGLHFLKDWVVGFSFGIGNDSWYVPINHNSGNIVSSIHPHKVAIEFFKQLKNSNVELVFHHALFDLSMIYRSFNVLLTAKHDTMALAYACGEEALGLESMADKYLAGWKMGEFKDLMKSVFGHRWKTEGKHFNDLSPEQAFEYACDDAWVTYNVLEPLLAKVKELKVGLIYDLEMQLLPVIMKLNFTGMKLDLPLLKQASDKFNILNNQRAQAIFTLADEEFNLSKSADVARILFGKLKLPVQKVGKTHPSTDADVLEALGGAHPIVPLIAEWRTADKLCTSYAEKLPKSVESNGKVYCIFNHLGARSGRLKSAGAEAHNGEKYGTNFQNVALADFELSSSIPLILPQGFLVEQCRGKKIEELEKLGVRAANIGEQGSQLVEVIFDADIRQAFIPSEGCDWLKGDYSQVEYRIMASLSGEERLIEGFKNGVDYHKQTASIMFRKPLDEITDELRGKGKVLNFGLSYGMHPFTLAKRTGMSEAEAQEKYEYYFKQVPKLAQFIAEVKEFARQHGYVKTFFGRTRFIPLDFVDVKKSESLLRAAFNTVIQGTAADILKIGMVRLSSRINKFGSDCKLVLNVHDELDFDVKHERVVEVIPVIADAMQIPVPSSWASITVDISIGGSWSKRHLKKYPLVPSPKPFVSWEDSLDGIHLG